MLFQVIVSKHLMIKIKIIFCPHRFFALYHERLKCSHPL